MSIYDHLIGQGPETDRAILIKLKDPNALARSQGSAATFAQAVAPAYVEGRVFDGFKQQLVESFKAKGIDADVSVVSPAQWKPAGQDHLLGDLGYALGGAGVIGIIWWLLSMTPRHKKGK